MPSSPDPYVPGHGDSRYAVEHYDLALDYRLATNRLDASATLRVRALTDTDTIRLDLSGLHVGKVRVDGRKPRRFVHKARVLTVTLDAPLPAGATASIDITYAGKPAPVPGPHGPAGWEELDDGILVASQPYGSPSWFPCNDRADDKASYRIAVGVESEYLSIATGTPTATSPRGGRTTRVFEMREPTSPYLVCVHIGRLVTVALGERLTLALPRGVVLPATSPLARLPEMLTTLEGWYGRYPFDGFTAVVVPDHLEIPLEAQAMASFGSNHVADVWDNERLVVHELSHQWFGNAVTARLMRDIWLHEGFACYTEWLWSEHRGLGTAASRARSHWTRLRGETQPTRLSDPGAAHMFDDWVYKRGALTVHAVRRALGDEAFFALLTTWVATHAGGVVTTADFVALAAQYTVRDLTPLFTAWLDQTALPPFPG